MVEIIGLEPMTPACKAGALQLSYTPIDGMVGLVGSNHRPYDYQSYALAS